MSVTIKKNSIGAMDNNCYLIYDDEGNSVVVDAPDNIGDEGYDGINKVINYVIDNNLSVKYILLTHGHYDHIAGLDKLKKSTGAKICISEGCKSMLTSIKDSLGENSPFFEQPSSIGDIIVKDGDKLPFGNVDIKIMLVPGHTLGDTVYKIGEWLFTGDTLFAGDIGRGDLPGGDSKLLLKNIKQFLLIHNDFKVGPGHGPDTSINHEKRYNPYIR